MTQATVDPAFVQAMQSWIDNPPLFAKEALGITFDDWQIEASNKFLKFQRSAVPASKGVGKSLYEACMGWFWMSTRALAQVICTSKDAFNLKDGLWKEISTLYGQSPFLKYHFEMNTEQAFHRQHKANWFMVARGWRKHADPIEQAQALAGKHGPAMLWLGDEAGSYAKAIMASGSAMLANAVPGSGNEAKILLGGNTTDPLGPFCEISKNPELWGITKVNADPDNPKRAKRVSIEWARQEIKDNHGPDNPWVQVSVFGEFPRVGFNSLVGPQDIQAAMGRRYEPIVYETAQKRMGVDVARFGDDSTVIYIRQGLKAEPPIALRNLDVMQVVDRVALEFKRHKCEMVFVDETGVGGGVVDGLRRVLKGVMIVGVNGSDKPTNVEKFYNRRAEMIWAVSDWVKDGGWLPAADILIGDELTAPTYNFKNGKVLIEEKAKIKEALGRSPDRADALALTFASPEMPSMGGLAGIIMQAQMARQRAKNHDPFAMNNRGDFDPFADRDQAPEFRGYDPNDRPSGG